MKLVIENADGRIRFWGEPPWAGQEDFPDTSIVDIGEQQIPDRRLKNYRYMNGSFVLDPLPPTQEEQDRQAFRTDAAKALFALMDDDLNIILDSGSTAAQRWAAVARTIQRQALIVRYVSNL
jgi:hypothetical protein